MDPAPKYSIAFKNFGFFAAPDMLLFFVLLLLVAVSPRYLDLDGRSRYSIPALCLCFLIYVVGMILEAPEENPSTQTRLQRTQPLLDQQPAAANVSTQIPLERPAETNRSTVVQLQNTQSQTERNIWIQLQSLEARIERLERLWINALLGSLPPLETYENSDKMEGSRDRCAVCLEEFKIGELVQPFPKCNHQFHASCINSWLLGGEITCPVCRCSC